jgi:hypothetical protein
MTLGPLLPAWVLQYDVIPAALPPWTLPAFAGMVGAVGACAVAAGRRGDHMLAALAGVAAATSIVVVVAARGIVGPMSDYLLLWATAVGALDAAVLLATAFRALPGAGAAAATAWPVVAAASVVAWAVIGGYRLVGKHAEQARDTTIRALATDLQAYCDRHGVRRPVLAFDGAAWQEAAGLVLQFAKADRPIAVEDTALYLVGRPFARTGREDGVFFVMPVASAAVPADAGHTAWVTTRGAFRILQVRVGGPP